MAPNHAQHHTSTAFSRKRFAHPFFLPVPPAQRQPFHGHTSLTSLNLSQLGPTPQPNGTGIMTLPEIIGEPGTQEITDVGEIRFHALGDSGVGQAVEAEAIGDDMATDFDPSAGGLNPAFLFHLGDVVYGPDKDAHYVDRFYRPYRHYPGKIIGIPGNHDGEERVAADSPSLKSFKANFCAPQAQVPPSAFQSGIFRETMTQPGVYWMLDAPFVRIVGLYSNRLENPGSLDGMNNGVTDTSQTTWLQQTLATIAQANDGKALVIATHHPPFSQSGHSGSAQMNQTIDDACTAAGLTPDLFLSGHAHNYQRYTRRVGGKQVPYIVVGTGGIARQTVQPASGAPVGPGLTYDAALEEFGYLLVTISATQLKTEFWQQGQQHTSAGDTATIDLRTHQLI